MDALDMDAGDPSRRDASSQPAGADKGLRRMLTWVFVALILTVLFAFVAVELTIRWFS
jgi:hypothetical protein